MKPSRPIVLTSLALGLLTAAPTSALACEDDVKVSKQVIRVGGDAPSNIRVLTADMLGEKAIKVLNGLCSESNGQPCVIRIGGGKDGPIAILLSGMDGMGQLGGQAMTFNSDKAPKARRQVILKNADGETIELDGDTWQQARGENGENIFVMKDGESGGWFTEDDKNIVKKRIKKGGHDGDAEHNVLIFVGEDGKVVELKGDGNVKWRTKDDADNNNEDVNVWVSDSGNGKKVKRFFKKGDGGGDTWFSEDGGDNDVDVFFDSGDDDGKHIIKKRIKKNVGEGDNQFYIREGADDGKRVIKKRIMKDSNAPTELRFGKDGAHGEIKIMIEGLDDLEGMKDMLHKHLGEIDIEIDTADLHEHLQKAMKGAKGGNAFAFEFDTDDLHEHLQHLEHINTDDLHEHLQHLKKSMGKHGNQHFEFEVGDIKGMPGQIEGQLRKHLGQLQGQHGQNMFEVEVEIEDDGNGMKPRVRFNGGNEAMRQRVMDMVRERVGDKADTHSFEIHVDVEDENEDGAPRLERQVWVTGPDGANMKDVQRHAHDNDVHEHKDADDREESLTRRINRLEDRLDRLTEQLERLLKNRNR